jgi:hypothetical protein
MEGRRVTATANDPETACVWGGTGDYHQAWEQDTGDGTAEVLHLGHIVKPNPGGQPAPRYPRQWAWAAYAVWPNGEPGAPGVYEWLDAADTWLVEGQPCPTQRVAVTAALGVARSRR